MPLIQRRVRAEEWRPIGIESLEDNALVVAQSINNRSVIAGPGSGKTELLAQRASYLLQCSISDPPRRILAISFKRDAAANLGRRVRSRCHPAQNRRFDSLTFDAFAKGFVDRFGQALPERWRPTAHYEIANASDTIYREFLRGLPNPPAAVGTRADVMSITVDEFERRLLLGSRLPEELPAKLSPGEWAADRYWQSSLHDGRHSFLTFPMIGRLAELIVRTNPIVKRALQLTYSHLFMDEFQDTTQVQYDLASTIFLGSEAIVTAVGDKKQQIMRWALAMDDPFAAFEADFKAERTPLLNNYRSSPDLVRIQDILAKALDAKSTTPVSKVQGTISGDSCAVWDFTSAKKEAGALADSIVKEMKGSDLSPRDFALLVRQKPGDYMKVLSPAFSARSLHLRNEAELIGPIPLQELLAEDLSGMLVTLLRLFASERAGAYWSASLELICSMRGLSNDDESGRARVVRELNDFEAAFKSRHAAPVKSEKDAETVILSLVDLIGRRNFLAACPAYRQGGLFEKVMKSAGLHLHRSSQGATGWPEALDVFEGLHAVPLMTIHKSKGLEYHTVIFVWLDDGAWWSFKKDEYEATAGFFVAFTRAKQRVVFCYCPTRGERSNIAPLYDLLKAAGVKTVAVA